MHRFISNFQDYRTGCVHDQTYPAVSITESKQENAFSPESEVPRAGNEKHVSTFASATTNSQDCSEVTQAAAGPLKINSPGPASPVQDQAGAHKDMVINTSKVRFIYSSKTRGLLNPNYNVG